MNALPPSLKYTLEDSERARLEWKATCGPHSIAAACGLTLDQVRPAIPNYRGWMNPTQMSTALVKLGRVHGLTHRLKTQQLCEGICRVQWEGPWLNPGVPASVAYHHTHWVAHFGGWVLCTAIDPVTWMSVKTWRNLHLSDGNPFHITHHYVFKK